MRTKAENTSGGRSPVELDDYRLSRPLPALRRPWELIILLIIVVSLGPLALSSFVPALPSISEDMGVDAGYAQLALSLSMLSIAVTTLLYGPLSDRFGRRAVLIVSFAAASMGSALAYGAQELTGLIWGRVIQAAGVASGMVIARAIVQDVFGPQRMASVMGLVTGVMMAAPLLGPFLGGFMVESWGWRSIFALIGLSSLVVTVVMLVRLPETHSDRSERLSMTGIRRDFGALLRNRDFMRFNLYVAMAQSGLLTFIGGAPLIVEGVFGHPASAIGYYVSVMALGYMVGSLAASRFSLVLERGGMMWVGSIISIGGLGLALVLALLRVQELGFLSLAIAAGAVGVGFALPAAQAGFTSAAAHIAGSASSLAGFMQMLVLAVSTQFVGMVQNADTAIPTVATMFVMTALSPVMLAVIPPRNPQRPAFFQRQQAA